MVIRGGDGSSGPYDRLRHATSARGAHRNRRFAAMAFALFLLPVALAGCRLPAITWIELTSGGVTVGNYTGDPGVVPIIVLAPGAAFTVTARAGNYGDESVVAIGEYSIFTSSNKPIRPATSFGTPTTIPPNNTNAATWTFSDSFAAGLAHDVYIVHVCAKNQSGTEIGCLDIQVNLTTNPGSTTAETVTFEYLRDCVLYGKLGSIESLLPFLPSNYRSEYTLMHGTRSRQAATFTQPRVIMTGPTAKLIVAFNGGDPNTPTDHSPLAVPEAAKELEMIQFRNATKSFEFRSIDFSGGKRVKISDPNPPLCLGCHGNNPRPNWEPFPYWPGAYGSSDDVVGSYAIGEFIGSPPVAQDPAVYCLDAPAGDPVCQSIESREAAENSGVVDFENTYSSHPRYTHLVNVLEGYASGTGSFAGVNNNVLTTRLARLNFQRIARQVSQSANPGQHPSTYSYSKFLIALLLSSCLESSTIPKTTYLPPGFMNVVPDSYHLGMLCHPAVTFYQCTYDAFFETLGYVTDDWPMNFYREHRSLAVPNFSTEPKSALLYWLVVQDSELAPYFNLSPNCTSVEYDHNVEKVRTCKAAIKPGASMCSDLAAAAYSSLAQWPSPPMF